MAGDPLEQSCNPRANGKHICLEAACFLLCAAIGIRNMPLLELASFRLWPAPVAGLECQDSFPV